MNITNHILSNKNERVTSYYGNRSFYLNDKLVTDFHTGIDVIDKTNGGDYIIAFEDGIITAIRDTISGFDEQNMGGNYVYIKHNETIETRYCHMKQNTIIHKPGDKVKKGDILGYTGSTGYVTGVHLHFEIRKNGLSLDPKPYLIGEQKLILLQYLGTPVSKDNSKNQITINAVELRVRDNPNGNILGYINNGTYNIIKSEYKDNYTWYQIEENYWIAYSEEWATLSLINAEETEELQKQIEELQKENEKLKNKYQKVFQTEKEDIYAIKLYKNEQLFINKED